VYRPYDLRVINDGKNSKEHTLDEYYTISALGIVHLYTEKVILNHERAKKHLNRTVQQVLSLYQNGCTRALYLISSQTFIFSNIMQTVIQNKI
jgi:hypothetical protein